MKNTNGFAMIEVLVALSITAFVLLSLLSYQIFMLRAAEASNFKTIATAQLMNLADMLYVSHHLSDQSRAFSHWQKESNNLLPNAQSDWDRDDDHVCDIEIRWFFRKKEKETTEVYC